MKKKKDYDIEEVVEYLKLLKRDSQGDEFQLQTISAVEEYVY